MLFICPDLKPFLSALMHYFSNDYCIFNWSYGFVLNSEAVSIIFFVRRSGVCPSLILSIWHVVTLQTIENNSTNTLIPPVTPRWQNPGEVTPPWTSQTAWKYLRPSYHYWHEWHRFTCSAGERKSGGFNPDKTDPSREFCHVGPLCFSNPATWGNKRSQTLYQTL